MWCVLRVARARVSHFCGVCLCFPNGSDLESDVFMCVWVRFVWLWVSVCVCVFGTLHVANLCVSSFSFILCFVFFLLFFFFLFAVILILVIFSVLFSCFYLHFCDFQFSSFFASFIFSSCFHDRVFMFFSFA